MSNADTVDSVIWEGWVGMLSSGSRMVSAAPLERMLRIKDIQRTMPPDINADRETQALLRAPLERQQSLIIVALAFRNLYEDILADTDPTLHH
jgi:hypothetical protein